MSTLSVSFLSFFLAKGWGGKGGGGGGLNYHHRISARWELSPGAYPSGDAKIKNKPQFLIILRNGSLMFNLTGISTSLETCLLQT